MGLFKFFFRAVRKSTRHSKRKTRVVSPSKQTHYKYSDTQLPPVLESLIVLSIKDVEKIQALPSVKVKHVIDGDTVLVDSDFSQVKIRLDSIDCPERGQEWGDISTRGQAGPGKRWRFLKRLHKIQINKLRGKSWLSARPLSSTRCYI